MQLPDIVHSSGRDECVWVRWGKIQPNRRLPWKILLILPHFRADVNEHGEDNNLNLYVDSCLQKDS